MGDPGGVLGAALGGFGADWGEQPPKKWPPSNPITVLDQKRMRKGSPGGPILGVKIDTKSNKKFNAILITFFGVPKHPPEAKKLYFHWRVVQNRRSAFLRPSAPEVDFGSHSGTQKAPKIMKNMVGISRKIRIETNAPKGRQKWPRRSLTRPSRVPGARPGGVGGGLLNKIRFVI